MRLRLPYSHRRIAPTREFAQTAFETVNLNYRDHVDIDLGLLRPTDLGVGRANPANAVVQLGWKASLKMHDVVRLMIEAERSY
jgi:GDPmannose 4,6-dehydratase